MLLLLLELLNAGVEVHQRIHEWLLDERASGCAGLQAAPCPCWHPNTTTTSIKTSWICWDKGESVLTLQRRRYVLVTERLKVGMTSRLEPGMWQQRLPRARSLNRSRLRWWWWWWRVFLFLLPLFDNLSPWKKKRNSFLPSLWMFRPAGQPACLPASQASQGLAGSHLHVMLTKFQAPFHSVYICHYNRRKKGDDAIAR